LLLVPLLKIANDFCQWLDLRYCVLLPLLPEDEPPEDSDAPVDELALTPKYENTLWRHPG